MFHFNLCVVLSAPGVVLLYSPLRLKCAFSGVIREEKDVAAMPDPQPVSTNSKSCLP